MLKREGAARARRRSPGAGPARHPAAAAGRSPVAPPAAADTLLAASPNAIIAVDAEGTIRYANPRVEATFGYRPRELIGESIDRLLPERVHELHVGHRQRFFATPIERPMGIGLDLSGRHRDGHEFPVEISLAPVNTDEGVFVFATIVDISARKAAEAALAESEERFRAVLEASPNAIVAIDAEGRIGYANPKVSQTFGYEREELIGQSVETLVPERVAEDHVAHRRRFVAAPVARPMGIGLELRGRHKDGREFPVEIELSPVEIAAGTEVFAVIVDISARKAAEAQLLEAQKLESVGRLAGGIAHDFNNILFAITGYAELLEQDLESAPDGELDREEALHSVRAISDAARRGASLTSQLLSFSRRQMVSERVVDVAGAVRAIVPMIRRLIGENVELVQRIDREAGRIRIDPGQLDQVLVNLVVNARDAMPDGGRLVIECRAALFDERHSVGGADMAPGAYVMLAVADTGVGMDEQTRARVFEPFFTTKERGKGTGLGLATTYGVVRQAGGHIVLYSEPGRGAVFRLYFPRVDGQPENELTADATPALPAAVTALIVEDEAAVREVTTLLLERAGLRVVAVADGAAALAHLEVSSEPIDVLVSDVVMPGISGIRLAEEVRRHNPSAGIVLLSGYTSETLDLEEITRRGARFVNKPAGSRELLAAVNEVLLSRNGTGG